MFSGFLSIARFYTFPYATLVTFWLGLIAQYEIGIFFTSLPFSKSNKEFLIISKLGYELFSVQ